MARRNVDLVIRNGTIVSGGGRFQADIAVADGQIIGIGRAAELALQPAEAFDATGCYVLPGVIDGHVHFREPGLEYKEDFESGSRAAVMGGVTTVIDMPNTRPPTASGVLVAEKRRLAQAKAYCDVALFGLLGADNLDELEPMAEAGVVGFKCFLGETVGNLPPPDDGALLDALQLSRGLGLRVGFHAENNAILQHATAALRASGRTDVWQAVSGFAGVETSVPLFLTYAVAQGRLSLERYVRASSETPARVWGLYPRKGAIQVGADADFTVVRLGVNGTIRASELHGKHRVSPYDGWATTGAPVATIVRGSVVMRDGDLVGSPHGQSVQPVSAPDHRY